MIKRLPILLLFIALAFMCLGCGTTLEYGEIPKPGSYTIYTKHEVNGTDRSYLLHIPKSYSPLRAYPLVVVLHGAFSTASEEADRTGFSRLADKEGFIAAYPNGMGLLGFFQHWNAGFCCGKAREIRLDDTGFVHDVIKDVQRRVKVDSGRIYLVGYSNGGMLAHRYAALKPDGIAALAVVAGTVGGREPDQNTMELVPPAKQPLSVLMMHGTADTHVPYEGGAQNAKAGKRGFVSVQRSALFWVEADHCKGRPEEQERENGQVLVQRWTNCSPGSEVQVYTLKGWGHFWPSRKLIQRYEKSYYFPHVDAAEMIWNFLKDKKLSNNGSGLIPEYCSSQSG